MRMKIFPALAATAIVAYSGAVSAQADCASKANLRLTIKMYHIDLNDRMPICVEVDEEFEITINNPPGGGHTVHEGDVTVEQKTEKDNAVMIISGSNKSPVNRLKIRVALADGKTKEDYKIGDEFEFWINIKGVGTLDPRIRVIGEGPGQG